MAVVTLLGSRIVTGLLATPRTMAPPGLAGGRLHVWCETIETNSGDNIASTYHMAQLISSARLLGISNFSSDIVSATGVLKIGLFNPTSFSGITDDDDCINVAGIATATAQTRVPVMSDPLFFGKRLWELVASQTTDPKQPLDLKLTLATGATTAAGTITVELYYTTD